jgi:hypothetical protein
MWFTPVEAVAGLRDEANTVRDAVLVSADFGCAPEALVDLLGQLVQNMRFRGPAAVYPRKDDGSSEHT